MVTPTSTLAMKNLIIPALIEKLPFCTKVLLQKVGAEDYRVIYQVDSEVVLGLINLIQELKKIDEKISGQVDRTIGLLKKLLEIPMSKDPEALDLIQEVCRQLEAMKT